MERAPISRFYETCDQQAPMQFVANCRNIPSSPLSITKFYAARIIFKFFSTR